MILTSPFSSLCEETAGKKVKVNQDVNLQDIFLTRNNNSFRGEPPVNSEKEYFVFNKYSEVPDNASILSEESSEVPDNASILSQESSEESRDSRERSEDSNLPTKTQKSKFFKLLKGLLEDCALLKKGMERRYQCNQDTLRLVYMKETCEVIIEDSSQRIKWRHTVPTRHIYLEWRYDEVETLSLRNLQRVQKEMRFLNIQNEKLEASFNLAGINFNQELVCVQQNAKLEIYCQDDVFLTFVSGKGENVIKIPYDNNLNEPVYTITVANTYTLLQRCSYEVYCCLADVLKPLGPFIGTCLRLLTLVFRRLEKAVSSCNAKDKKE